MSNDSAATTVRLSTYNTPATRSKGQRQNMKRSLKHFCDKNLQSLNLGF
ncbi:hypothetical protein H6G97_15965 [Nostoc flagelliforme FACHB-838]|uniref:Uncharacterized protein n=1 Tax=Nostoc flagelliforme FACHB-838 TaxID=2692904 RepID=A0ABR8DNH8_9NOSO|nr:hypothetical protein [Nostoc flagelliforme]MBD2530994.1 hypothetical protein [Nostoc flagelliforme FACHB-838]